MAVLIRHICGERKNTLGHRWPNTTPALHQVMPYFENNNLIPCP